MKTPRYYECFVDVNEWTDCVRRGAEITFTYDNNAYFVGLISEGFLVGRIKQHHKKKDDLDIIYQKPEETLSYLCSGKPIKDILQDMQVIDRTL